MKKEDVIETCYSVLKRYTPLDFDCGRLCNGKCCGGDENTGMLLFPGEEKLIDPVNITVKESDDGTLVAVCEGRCDRNRRPLSCRIYPVFPLIIENDGKEYVEVDFDKRADCPLTKGDITLNRRFCKAVKRVGKYLLLNEETAAFYRGLSEEISEYIELEKIFSKKS